MFYLHLETHSIAIFHILNAVHLTGELPLIHEIVPENIPLPFSCPNCITALIWKVIVLEHYRTLVLPPMSSCWAVGYLILSRLCSTKQAMTTLLTTWGSCCSGLWKILKWDVRHSQPQFFPTWSYIWRPSPSSPYCGWSMASLARAWGGRRRPREGKSSPLVHQSPEIHCQGIRCCHPLFVP